MFIATAILSWFIGCMFTMNIILKSNKYKDIGFVLYMFYVCCWFVFWPLYFLGIAPCKFTLFDFISNSFDKFTTFVAERMN